MVPGVRKWLGAAVVLAVVSVGGSASAQTGTGLRGDYYTWDQSIATPPPREMVFVPANLILSQIDAKIDTDFSATPPRPAAVPPNYWGARWTGEIVPAFSEDYTFCTASDDGTRLWVSDKPIDPAKDTPTVDNWKQQGETEVCADTPISMTKGKMYNIVMEYEQGNGGESARLRWSSASQAKGAVPTSALFPPVNPDTVAPAAVTDLKVASTTHSTATLTFTAPADTGTGSSGSASQYSIVYSTLPITAANFSTASVVTGLAAPQKAGSKESITVSGLNVLENYYFAVKSQDAATNVSAPSNVVQGQTMGSTTTVFGLLGQYYPFDSTQVTLPPADPENQVYTMDQLKATRIDPQINFNFDPSDGSRPANIPHDNWGAKWTGTVTPAVTDDYTFCTASDDGTYLWVSDKPINPASDTPIVSNWLQQGETEKCADAPIHMVAGTAYNLVMEYEQGGGGESARLRWSGKTVAKQIIPADVLSPPAASGAKPQGRVEGLVTDANGAAVSGANVNIVEGMTTITTATDANGFYSSLAPAGAATVTAALPAPYDTNTKQATVTLAAGKLSTQSFQIGAALYYWSLRTADLAAAGAQPWDFLQATPDDDAAFAGSGDQNMPDPATLNKWCDANLKTTGVSALLPGHTWLNGWQYVPGDVGALGRQTPPDPSGIPDNSWWVEALHFKVPSNLSQNKQWTLQDFNMDDYGELFCINGTKIGGTTQNDWTIDRKMPVPDGVIKTDGSDNLLVMVGFEGGGGAGHNEPYPGPRFLSVGPAIVNQGFTIGDINNDGKIDLKDATLSLQIAVGNLPSVTDLQKKADDANKDGKQDLKDTTLILEAAVGLIKLM